MKAVLPLGEMYRIPLRVCCCLVALLAGAASSCFGR